MPPGGCRRLPAIWARCRTDRGRRRPHPVLPAARPAPGRRQAPVRPQPTAPLPPGAPPGSLDAEFARGTSWREEDRVTVDLVRLRERFGAESVSAWVPPSPALVGFLPEQTPVVSPGNLEAAQE